VAIQKKRIGGSGVKDYAVEIKDDKSLWERMTLPDTTETLIVEESYYDGIIEDVEKLQEKIETYEKALKFYSNENSYITNIGNGVEIEATVMIDNGDRAREALKKEEAN
jgi:hypothetical protein